MGVNVQTNIFFIWAVVIDEWLASCSGRFNREEMAPGSHWIGSWVDL
jgi:hypothetical protein